jgi:hypothetical protein
VNTSPLSSDRLLRDEAWVLLNVRASHTHYRLGLVYFDEHTLLRAVTGPTYRLRGTCPTCGATCWSLPFTDWGGLAAQLACFQPQHDHRHLPTRQLDKVG